MARSRYNSMDIPIIWDRPVTAWASLLTGALALCLLVVAILVMSRRMSAPVSHENVAYTAMAIIVLHAIIGLVARFMIGI